MGWEFASLTMPVSFDAEGRNAPEHTGRRRPQQPSGAEELREAG